MTREHKLALIIGFSLVLVVGVLISDHFSKARSATVATEITPGSESVFGNGTNGLKVATATPPVITGATITTPPEGMGSDGIQTVLPQTTQPRFSEPSSPAARELVMGDKPASTSLVTSMIENATTPLVGNSVVDDSSGVRPIGRDGQLAPVPAPVVNNPPAGMPAAPAVSSIKTATAEPVRDDAVNGVPLPMMKRHDVREGESIYRIAQDAYGDGKLWKKLLDYNKGKISANGSVRQGVTLLLPPREALLGKPLPTETAANRLPETDTKKLPASPIKPPAKPEPSKLDPRGERAVASAKTYTVQRGDSLSDIAKKTLGSSRRWSEIVDLNKDVLSDEDALVVGLTLKLPSR